MHKVYAPRTDIKENATDAAIERETVISFSDADSVIHISTSQAKWITRMKKNPSATLIEVNDKTHFFELPVGLITDRKGKRAASTTTRKKKPMPANAQRCGAKTKDGSPCGSLASKATGRCARHSK